MWTEDRTGKVHSGATGPPARQAKGHGGEADQEFAFYPVHEGFPWVIVSWGLREVWDGVCSGSVPPLLSPSSLKSKVTPGREGERESKRKEGRKERRKEGREGGIKGNRTCHRPHPHPQPPHPQRSQWLNLCAPSIGGRSLILWVGKAKIPYAAWHGQ